MDRSKSEEDTEQRFRELQRSLAELPEADQDKTRRDYARQLMHGIGEKLHRHLAPSSSKSLIYGALFFNLSIEMPKPAWLYST